LLSRSKYEKEGKSKLLISLLKMELKCNTPNGGIVVESKLNHVDLFSEKL